MPRKALDTTGRGAQTRRKVLEAALAVVSDRPLADVQLQHIAARAGISPGHVLYHFGSKDQILVETLRWSEENIARQRARELSEIDDPKHRLERWIILYLPHGAGDPTWKLWLELWLRSAMDEDLRQLPATVAKRWIVDLDRILADGVEREIFAPVDRSAFITWAHSLLVGLSIGVLAGWQDLDAAVRIALRVIGKELGCTLRRPRDRRGSSDGRGRSSTARPARRR
jgi:AcrR family transcriptional regulator